MAVGRPKGSRNQTPINITKAIQNLWKDPSKIRSISYKLEDIIQGDNNKDALKAIEILLKYIAVSSDKMLEAEVLTETSISSEEKLERIRQLSK